MVAAMDTCGARPKPVTTTTNCTAFARANQAPHSAATVAVLHVIFRLFSWANPTTLVQLRDVTITTCGAQLYVTVQIYTRLTIA